MTRHQAALDRNSLITSVAHAVEALRAARAAAGKSNPDAVAPAVPSAEAGPAGALVPPLRRSRQERASSRTPADGAVLEPLQAPLRVRPVARAKPGLRAVTKTPSQPGLDQPGVNRSGASRPGESDQDPQKPGDKREIKAGQTCVTETAQGLGEGGVTGLPAGEASLEGKAAGEGVTAGGLAGGPIAATGAESLAQPGGAGPGGAQPTVASTPPIGQVGLVAEGPTYTAELEPRGSTPSSQTGPEGWGGQRWEQRLSPGQSAPTAPQQSPDALTTAAPAPSGVAAPTELQPNNGEEQRQQLWREYRRQPNDQSRNLLVEAYQPLVREIVARFGARLPRTVDRGDLATAANMGLIAAIQSFDGARGVRFEAYGDRRIRGALLDELRTQDWLPRPWRRRLERHKQALERLCSELGREPHDEEVATALGLSLSDYQGLFGLGWPVAPSGGGGGSGADGDEDGPPAELDVFADPRAASPGEALTREELLTLCAQRMSAQEHQIVHLKYWEELSLREIGERTGLSESRICKIHTRLLERLAERLSGLAEWQ
jgi:RNA polymerase sigma factor for flagellar operon FliA